MGVTKRSSYIVSGITCSERVASFLVAYRPFAHQCEDRRLRHDEVAVALERDLDGSAPEKERVVADLGLHWDKPRFACPRSPRFVGRFARIGHGQPRARGDDPAALYCL